MKMRALFKRNTKGPHEHNARAPLETRRGAYANNGSWNLSFISFRVISDWPIGQERSLRLRSSAAGFNLVSENIDTLKEGVTLISSIFLEELNNFTAGNLIKLSKETSYTNCET